MASRRASISTSVCITKDGQLKSATINGKEIDPNGSYRIATIDYLAHGNDKMTAYKAATDVVSLQEEKYDTRYIIRHYFQEMTKAGKAVDGHVEGRIVVQ